MIKGLTVATGNIPLWGTIKIYARDVEMTCGRAFIKYTKARVEKRYHKVWSKITEKEVMAVEESIMASFIDRIANFTPALITHGRFGLVINGSTCTLTGHTGGSVLLKLMNTGRLRYLRHSGEWEQFSLTEVYKIQKAYNANDHWTVIRSMCTALLDKKLRLAEALALVIDPSNSGQYQPMDVFELFTLDGHVHAKTIWGEVIPVCAARGPDGPMRWKQIKHHYKSAIRKSLLRYFG